MHLEEKTPDQSISDNVGNDDSNSTTANESVSLKPDGNASDSNTVQTQVSSDPSSEREKIYDPKGAYFFPMSYSKES